MRKTLITIAAIGGVYLLYKYLTRTNKNEQEVASGSNVIQETIAIVGKGEVGKTPFTYFVNKLLFPTEMSPTRITFI